MKCKQNSAGRIGSKIRLLWTYSPLKAQWLIKSTTNFKIKKKNSTLCPKSETYPVWLAEHSAIISAYNIDWVHNRQEACFLRGTNYIFKYNSGKILYSERWTSMLQEGELFLVQLIQAHKFSRFKEARNLYSDTATFGKQVKCQSQELYNTWDRKLQSPKCWKRNKKTKPSYLQVYLDSPNVLRSHKSTHLFSTFSPHKTSLFFHPPSHNIKLPSSLSLFFHRPSSMSVPPTQWDGERRGLNHCCFP